MLIFLASCLIALFVFNIVFGASVFVGNHRSRRVLLFMIFDVAVALWSLGIGLFYLSNFPDIAGMYVRLYYCAAALIAYSLLLFVMDYTGRIISRKSLLSLSIPFIFIIGIVLHPSGLVGEISLYPNPTVELNQFLYLLYALYFLAYFMASIVTMWQDYSSVTRKSDRKLSSKYILIAIVVSGVFGMIFNLFLPLLGNYNLIWIGPIGSIWMVSLISIAVIRHSLFDIRQAVIRTVAYILALMTMAGVYFGLAYLVSVLFFRDNITTSVSLSPINIFLALVLALIFQPIKQFFDHWTNRIFYRDRYDKDALIARLSRVLTTTTQLDDVLEHALREIVSTLKSNGGLFIVQLANQESLLVGAEKLGGFSDEETHLLQRTANHYRSVLVVNNEMSTSGYASEERLHKVLAKRHVALVLPLSTADQMVGYLLLGEQMASNYTKRDIEVLETVADELVIAIQNAKSVQVVRDLNAHLEQRINSATKELQLSNKRLLELDATKDEFISMASHQLRTPLTTIKGYVSMLLDGDAGELSPQQEKLLKEAFNSSQRMVYLIADFLNISRIQTGKFVIELADVNLADILDEEIEQLRTNASARQIELIYDKPVNFPLMPVDEGKIRQVMMNFIDNAIYYSQGENTVNVVPAASRTGVEFKVIDRGIGVPKAEQHKLFMKFSRASNAKKQRPDGTGIGLFMAKKVVVALGGSIIFESKEGVGSTFGFRLNRSTSTSKGGE